MVVLLVIALITIGSTAIPLLAMRPYLRDQSLYWPGYRRIERSDVSVGDGAFRDGTAAVETLREAPPGIPTAVKLTSFLALFFGQLFPILGMYAGFSLLVSVVFFSEYGLLSGLNILVAILGACAWAMAARSSWSACFPVLRGEEVLAEAALQKSVKWHLATLGTVVAAIVFALVSSFDLSLVALSAPFFALTALAMIQQAVFRAHKSKLPYALREQAQTQHGSSLTRVRAQDFADPPAAAADVHDASAIEAHDQRRR